MSVQTPSMPWILDDARHRAELLWLLACAEGDEAIAAEMLEIDPTIERRLRRRYVIDGPPLESDRRRRRRFEELWHVHLALLERL